MKKHTAKQKAGFTLIELMIVVSVIGILSGIALPKFASMVRKSREAATAGNLGSIRSAINIYYADMAGEYPTSLDALTTDKKYIDTIPPAWTYEYGKTNNVTYGL
jgi:prepilin-type N-terminal cleavage/methylation domain-containing protein